MNVFFDKYEPFAITREQGFNAVPVEIQDSRVLKAIELIAAAEEEIGIIQQEYGHLDGKELQKEVDKVERVILLLLQKLRRLRNR